MVAEYEVGFAIRKVLCKTMWYDTAAQKSTEPRFDAQFDFSLLSLTLALNISEIAEPGVIFPRKQGASNVRF